MALALAPSSPATSFDEAIARARAVMMLDDASIRPEAFTRLIADAPADLAVVLFHGYTNHPGQYRNLAPMIRARGANIFIPRMPEHGDRDRMTERLRLLTAERWLASATEAIDIACGLGKRVAVLGISTGGLLCDYAMQFRGDVWRCVPVSPLLSVLQLPFTVSDSLGALMRWMPNAFLFWDARVGVRMRPHTAYPRFSTRALGEALRIAALVYDASAIQRPLGGSVITIANPGDPAVSNEVTSEVTANWRRFRRDGVAYREIRKLSTNHDIIEPDVPGARTDRVYPVLLDALFTQEITT